MSHLMPTDEELAWRAVLARDQQADGRFVYAVTSTRIYCRPSCPSRRPRRERVRFFADALLAERDGFRACRRCRPKSARSPAAALVRRACTYLEQHLDRKVTLAELARELDVSPFHLQRTFKRSCGVSPRAFVAERRAATFRAALARGESVTRAGADAGYGSSSRIYAATAPGLKPSAQRSRGAAQRIRFATTKTAIGWAIVAVTDAGVCALRLGDDTAALEAELRADYARAASVERDPRALAPWLREIVALAHGKAINPTLPLDVRATAFQARVWAALRKVPSGETRSYAELAREIGRPRAARAVARACAQNPVALLIPCHRVVPVSGGSGGYRWGTARKRALLAAEKQ